MLLVLLALRAAAQPGDTGEFAAADQTITCSLKAQHERAALSSRESFPQGDEQILYVRSWKPFDPGTMLAQAGCALVTETVAWFAGFYLGGSLGGMFFSGHVLASLAGAPAGVQIGGDLRRGNGKFLGTLAGGAVGTILGLATARLLHDATDPWLIMGSMYASITVPAIVGYHLSASRMNYYFYKDAPGTASSAKHGSGAPAFTSSGRRSTLAIPASATDPVRPRPDVQVTVLQVSF